MLMNNNPILSQVSNLGANAAMGNPMARLMPQIQQAKNLLGQLRGAPNSQMMLNQMMMSNPQLRDVMNYIQNEHGGNAEQAFYAYAKQVGINPQDIINQFK